MHRKGSAEKAAARLPLNSCQVLNPITDRVKMMVK